jgi:uncharacterized membrane protein
VGYVNHAEAVRPGSRRAPRNGLAAALRGALFVAYPFVVYTAYGRLGTRGVGAVLLALYALAIGLRVRGSLGEVWALARQHLGIVGMIGLAVVSGERIVLLLLPIAISLYLLWTFGSSLLRGPPMIERLARLVEEDLPDFTLPYCRKVTIAWCVFLAANSACIGWLALAAPLSWWALYVGFLFYLLVGLMLGGEFLLRKLWFRYYGEGAIDRLLARLFPAERTANGRRSLAYATRRRAAASA